MRAWYLPGIFCGMLMSVGCHQRLGDFTFLATKNIDLSNLNMEVDPDASLVKGEDSRAIIFVYPLGVPSVEEAVDRAVESGRGTALGDAVVYYDWWYVPYIVGEMKFSVRGKVVGR